MTDLITLAIPAMLGLLVLEVLAARFLRRDLYDARDSAASLATGVGSVVVGAFWKGVLLAIYFVLYEHRLFEFEAGLGLFVAALLADDFAYYWFHRLHHEVRFFWASHVQHHSSERYNLSTALRQSWFPVTGIPFYAPLALLGFPPLLLLTVHAINTLYQFWIHTELIDRLPRPIEWVFNTPSHHRVHHGSNPLYLDRNYGATLIMWDRLFGTFEAEAEPVRFGLTKNIETYNPLRIEFQEWIAIARDVVSSRSILDALGHAFARPGWRPNGEGKTAVDLRREAEAAGLAEGSVSRSFASAA
jgi:sterol desaturase/sphingolipid hydroxylase (fatty acid hydroxylase superfamily)